MGKFIKSDAERVCKQTGKIIKLGENCYYSPRLGYFHKESIIYRDKVNSGGVRMGKNFTR